MKTRLHSYIKTIVYLLFFSYLLSCGNSDNKTSTDSNSFPNHDSLIKVQNLSYELIDSFTHDTNLFTEGLVFYEGQLFESTGSPFDSIKSVIGISDFVKGAFTPKVNLDSKKYFGEGITILDNKVYQLTYKNQIGFVYDYPSFKKIDSFFYNNIEGWGLTHDSTYLIMSDGTDVISFLDPKSRKVVKELKVTGNGIAQNHLNELEYINDFIYANIWQTNRIIKIDPITGVIHAQIDLSPLAYDAKMKKSDIDVMNGIAYDPEKDRVFITGKFWKNIYQIKFKM